MNLSRTFLTTHRHPTACLSLSTSLSLYVLPSTCPLPFTLPSMYAPLNVCQYLFPIVEAGAEALDLAVEAFEESSKDPDAVAALVAAVAKTGADLRGSKLASLSKGW